MRGVQKSGVTPRVVNTALMSVRPFRRSPLILSIQLKFLELRTKLRIKQIEGGYLKGWEIPQDIPSHQEMTQLSLNHYLGMASIRDSYEFVKPGLSPKTNTEGLHYVANLANTGIRLRWVSTSSTDVILATKRLGAKAADGQTVTGDSIATVNGTHPCNCYAIFGTRQGGTVILFTKVEAPLWTQERVKTSFCHNLQIISQITCSDNWAWGLWRWQSICLVHDDLTLSFNALKLR